MRRIQFITGEYYHVYNRGVDKRDIVCDAEDCSRFLQSMSEFNVVKPIGSIYAASFRKKKQQKEKDNTEELRGLASKEEKLVDTVCYCQNPNHYHFILRQVRDGGIVTFMHRLGTGYSSFFNQKYERSGSLFQGPFKAIHVNSNDYLLHASAYVNLNNRVHGIQGNLFRSSWEEYTGQKDGFCAKDIILNQFKSNKEYKEFAINALKTIKEYKAMESIIKLEGL